MGGRSSTGTAYQKNEEKRKAIFQKRKSGLYKKVMEVEMVSRAKILCVLQSTEPKGKVCSYQYATGAEDNCIPKLTCCKSSSPNKGTRTGDKFIENDASRIHSFHKRTRSVYHKALELELLCGAYVQVTVDLIDEKKGTSIHYRYAPGGFDNLLPPKCLPLGWGPECASLALAQLAAQNNSTSGVLVLPFQQSAEFMNPMEMESSSAMGGEMSGPPAPSASSEVYSQTLRSIPSVPSVTSMLVDNSGVMAGVTSEDTTESQVLLASTPALMSNMFEIGSSNSSSDSSQIFGACDGSHSHTQEQELQHSLRSIPSVPSVTSMLVERSLDMPPPSSENTTELDQSWLTTAPSLANMFEIGSCPALPCELEPEEMLQPEDLSDDFWDELAKFSSHYFEY